MSVPFSPDQFAGPDSPLPLKRIPLDKVDYSQAYLDGAKIERMRKTWSKDMAEPVVADRGTGRYTVLDGHHRTAAAIARGHKYLRVRVSE